jgi:VanZ family protein
VFVSASPEFIDSLHYLIRKSAHFIFYGILAVLALRAFTASSKSILASNPVATAFIATLIVASLDEFNQSFNPARTGTPNDVILDLSGGAVFLLTVFLYRRLCGR